METFSEDVFMKTEADEELNFNGQDFK